MKKYVLAHKRTALHYRTESLTELMEKLKFMESEGDDLDDSIVIELDAEDLKNSPPICRTATAFIKSVRRGP